MSFSEAQWPLNFVTLVDLLRYRVAHNPHKILYYFLTDGENEAISLTYAQLDQQAQSIAARLQTLTTPGDRALVISPPGFDFIISFFGCLYAGVVAVPVPPGSNQQVSRIQAISDDAQAKVILTNGSMVAKLQRQFRHIPSLQALSWLVIDQPQNGGELAWQEVALTGNTLALLQYTSGSTSAPKGVMVSHQNFLANVDLIRRALGPDFDSEMLSLHTGVSWLPMYHDMGLMHVLEPLYLNATTAFMSPTAFMEKPLRWLQAITRYRAAVSGGPNFAYELCLEKITPEQRQTLDLSSWLVAFCGAEPIHAETLQRFANTFAPCGFSPNALYPSYGLAEATLMVSGGQRVESPIFCTVSRTELNANRVVDAPPDSDDAYTIVGCGHALPGQKIVIVDPVTCMTCPPGCVGEIWVAGPGIAQGYWNHPEETTAAFRAFLWDTGDGPFLRTGDVGFLHKGELFITGRIKDMIIIQGRNYYPQDIEYTVSLSHSALKAELGAAFAVTVEGIERLVIVHEVDRSYLPLSNPDEVIAAMRLAIAREHGLLASAVCLVKPWQLPRTSSGKVQHYACREQFLHGSLETIKGWSTLPDLKDPAPNSDQQRVAASEIETPHKQLTTAIERWLAREIARSLDLKIEDIASDQPFTRFGVDSMEAINMACVLEMKLDRSLPATLIWEHPSLHQLAEHLAREAVETHPTNVAEVIQRFAEGPTTPIESRTQPTAPSTAGAPPAQPSTMSTPEQTTSSFGQQRLAQLNERYHLGQETGNYFYQPVITKHEGAWVVCQDRRMLMMASYSYLGLLGHPRINAAAQAALQEFGTGTHGVRLLAGTISLHRKLEQTIARFKRCEDAVVFTSGYTTNMATISALVTKGYAVICDQLDHASIIDGCTLSQAQFMAFRHNDMEDLERCLRQVGQVGKLVVVDAVFSMDGDVINLPEVVRLCKQYGAYLMVDEAHSLGVLGATGHGIEEHFGVDSQAIDVKMGTLSKTIPSVGGYIAGTTELITALKHNAHPFIFSAALPPPQIAAAQAAFEVIEAEPQLVATLQHKIRHYHAGLHKAGFNTLNSETAIVPLVCATELQAFEMTRLCQAEGLFVLPVVYPAVPLNTPRLRTTITAQHTDEDIDFALDVFQRAGKQCGLIS